LKKAEVTIGDRAAKQGKVRKEHAIHGHEWESKSQGFFGNKSTQKGLKGGFLHGEKETEEHS